VVAPGFEILSTKFYNILSRIGHKIPPILHPATGEVVKQKDLEPLFAKEIIKQEVSTQKYIKIPEQVLETYSSYRPTPLTRARNLEKFLKTPAKIFFKNESVSKTGSHKPNTAIAQAYYSKKEGVKKLTTETGAGQWGSALSYACNIFDLDCLVYMVRVSYDQKPGRKELINYFGGKIYPSPSNSTRSGRFFLKQNLKHPGSLGIAISEAVEIAANDENTKYSLGSVLNHVMLHQTVIGLETKKQMERIGEHPDMIIGCVGGGSNFAGISYPFVKDKEIDLIAVEPTVCASIGKGKYEYDYGDSAKLTPKLKMYTLGYNFIPPSIHAGGLRYHGVAPTMSLLVNMGRIKEKNYNQIETFEAGEIFAKTEGFLPAPETNHAIKAVIEEAIKCRQNNEKKTILFNLSGHGHYDAKGYVDFFKGDLA
jgi:tryptophan synthase beta chain